MTQPSSFFSSCLASAPAAEVVEVAVALAVVAAFALLLFDFPESPYPYFARISALRFSLSSCLFSFLFSNSAFSFSRSLFLFSSSS